MNVDPKKSPPNGCDNSSISKEHEEKVNEVRRLLGPIPGKLPIFCSNACIARYLRAQNWNVKKATKMLKETLKWRLECKPEEIKWDEVAHEAETGKIYRSNFADKHGRTVLIMRPCRQNSKSVKSQMKFLVYCMENAIMNLPENQEQMVWLIDFHGFGLSNISVKSTRETANVLQIYYPERLGVAILYNPPKFFEPFWTVVKPFLEPKTANKVKFVYSEDPNTQKIMEDLFDIDQLELAFGGKDTAGFDIKKYAERMREDDKKMPSFWARANAYDSGLQQSVKTATSFNPMMSESDSDGSDEKADECSSRVDEVESEAVSGNYLPVTNSSSSAIIDVKSYVC